MAAKAAPPIEDEARLRRSLRRSRAIATGLLAVAAVIFLGTSAWPGHGFWPGLVRAGAEAALVGGLADWFAVTALFRHPLGLPIPRTAIVPKNKDRIGAGLGAFVERNFLAPEILAAKLAALAPVSRVAAWLGEGDHAALVADRVAQSLPSLIRSLGDRELRDFVARSFHEQLQVAELAPTLGRFVALVTKSGQYDALFDRALAAARNLLLDHQDRLFEAVSRRSQWWVPRAVDRHIAASMVQGIDEVLAELLDPASDARHQFRASVERVADDLVSSPAWRHRVAEFKARLLEQPEVKAWLAATWDEMRQIALDDLASPSSRTHAALTQGLASLGRTLATDDEMQRRLHAGLEHLALAVVPWRGQIATLIAEVVRSWDADTVSQRLELAMGSDLQYIRVSGTLVGACVGCVLYLIVTLAF